MPISLEERQPFFLTVDSTENSEVIFCLSALCRWLPTAPQAPTLSNAANSNEGTAAAAVASPTGPAAGKSPSSVAHHPHPPPTAAGGTTDRSGLPVGGGRETEMSLNVPEGFFP